MSHPCIIPWNESRKRQHAKGFAMPFVNQDSCEAKQLALHISVIKPNEGARQLPRTKVRGLQFQE